MPTQGTEVAIVNMAPVVQALKELALDYENDKANVPVPIMYDDNTAYLCDQGSA